MIVRSLTVAALVLVLGLVPPVLAAAPKSQILDMTYPFDEQSIYWPTATPFKLTRVAYGVGAGGYFYSSNDFTASEHGGTHVDAPLHFAEKGRSLDQVKLEEWIGPAVKIDVTARCEKDRNYTLQVEDVKAWEATHGRIPARAWVLMYTGIDTRHYPKRKQVLGTTRTGVAALPLLSFPGFSAEVAQFLVKERDIAGIGLDTPSIDPGKSKDFPVHRIICGADKLAVENVAHLDQLPPAGWTLYVIPIPIGGGSGGPARVFAVGP